MDKNELPAQTNYELMGELVSDPVKRVFGIEGTGIDGRLQDLVRLVNESSVGFSFGITLFTSTGVITGDLISADSYSDLFAEHFKAGFEKAFPDGDWSLITDIFSGRKDGEEPLPEGEYVTPPQFIHLNNSSLLMDNGVRLLKEGALWRGKIQSINGFILGTMS
ncbi:hypothetical protein [Pseudomonas syringae]|uniref:hypothetical protein n=1 Tax=Pseudomonas syringae TaxID=317 RepID=UPI001F0D67C9|nr:hypothetical protein [Pseudomonas syringae]MCH5515485.1 hypothetical protein [Pseudomonas syringae pv. syringae]MCH5626939.1 hypothetical protein [Pseudomonas syringae pv. syringae]